jgi:hypothetical protein
VQSSLLVYRRCSRGCLTRNSKKDSRLHYTIASDYKCPRQATNLPRFPNAMPHPQSYGLSSLNSLDSFRCHGIAGRLSGSRERTQNDTSTLEREVFVANSLRQTSAWCEEYIQQISFANSGSTTSTRCCSAVSRCHCRKAFLHLDLVLFLLRELGFLLLLLYDYGFCHRL